MKATAKKILSFVIVACLAFIGVFTAPIIAANAADVTGDKYVKVTEAPNDWSGDYLIVYEDGNVAFNGGLATLDGTGNTIDVDISEGVIEANDTTNAAKFTIKAIDGGYSIKSASGFYIGRTATSNGFNSDQSTEYVNKLSYSNGTTIITSSGGPTLQYYLSGANSRFRYYKSSQKAITLYKFVSGDAPIVEPDPDIQKEVDEVQSYMSLSYTYTQETVKVTGVTDILNREKTGVAVGTTYKEWTYTEESSGVVYVGQSAADMRKVIGTQAEETPLQSIHGL